MEQGNLVRPGKKGERLDTRTLCKMALCVAMMAVSSYLSFPLPFTPAPVTAQTMMVSVIALLLPPFASCATILVYLVLGLVGVPVFAGFTGGLSVLVSPNSGFLWGFLIAAPLISLAKGKGGKIWRWLVCTIGIGMPVIYFFGVLVMSLSTGKTPMAVLSLAVIPFLFGDLLKCVAACYLAAGIQRAMKVRKIA